MIWTPASGVLVGTNIPIRLTWYESDLVAVVGAHRQTTAGRNQWDDQYGAVGDSLPVRFMKHLNGAGGECAYAKASGLYWDASVNTFGQPDVGLVHIRTRSDAQWELPIRPKDPVGIFVMVVGVLPEYRIVGWYPGHGLHGTERTSPYWKDPGGHGWAWFIPQSDLRQFPIAPP